jgi:hypothetical protein
MKVMMIDMMNYASKRLDDWGDFVKPHVWDVHVWSDDMIRYYQHIGYNVVLFTTEKCDPKSTDIVNDLCIETDIWKHFTRSNGYVIYSHYDPGDDLWKQYSVKTDDSVFVYAVNFVRSFELEDFFVTADSHALCDACNDMSVRYQSICETHAISL